MAAVSGGDIWTSADGGQSWTDDSTMSINSATSGLPWASITSSASGQYLAAVGENGLGEGIWTADDASLAPVAAVVTSNSPTNTPLQTDVITIKSPDTGYGAYKSSLMYNIIEGGLATTAFIVLAIGAKRFLEADNK